MPCSDVVDNLCLNTRLTGYWMKHADRLGEKNKKKRPRAPMLGKDLPLFKTRNDHFTIHRRNSICQQDAEWSNVLATLQANSFPPHFHDPVPIFPWKFKKRNVRGGSLRLSQLLQNCLATDHVVRFSPISHFSVFFLKKKTCSFSKKMLSCINISYKVFLYAKWTSIDLRIY